MANNSWAFAALLVPFASMGCRDDQDISVLKSMAQRTTSSQTATGPEQSVLPTPPDKRARHGGCLVELPNRAGSVEWVHKPGEQTGRFYFSDSQSRPIENVTDPLMWLAGPTGPLEVPVEACRPAERGCLQMGSPQLAESVPRGLLRLQIGRERHRITLPRRLPEPVTKPVAARAKSPEQPEQPK